MNKIAKFRGEYAFLSNFYPATVFGVDGWEYPSVEHAVQAAKTDDENIRKAFQVCPTCAEVKKAGRTIDLRPNWDDNKVKIMYELVYSKFDKNPRLRNKLLETGDADLEEGNSHGDKFWGTVNGEGQNYLGRILMMVREQMHAKYHRS